MDSDGPHRCGARILPCRQATQGPLGRAWLPEERTCICAMGRSRLSAWRVATLLCLVILAVNVAILTTGKRKMAPPARTYWCASVV